MGAGWTGFDARLFASVFGIVFLAELPDKTAFAALILATRKNPAAIFLGAAAAFVVQSAVAVALGSALGALPREPVRIFSGLLFLALAAAMWLRREPEESSLGIPARDRDSFFRAVGISFVVIFIAEWGDLTQFATAALAAKNRAPVTVFCSATLALWAVALIAVTAGHNAKARIKPALLKRVASAALAAAGLVILVAA